MLVRKPLKLSRRTVLRGLLGGTAVAMGLPALEVFLDDHGEALADGTGFPKRFGLWFFGNGVHAFAGEDLDPFSNERILAKDFFRPIGTGKDWVPNVETQILDQIRDRITIVSGLDVLFENTVPHGSGPAGVLSGNPIVPIEDTNFSDSTFAGATLDQIIAQRIGKTTFLQSLEVGIEGGADNNATVMYSGQGQPIAPDRDVMSVYARLFGPNFVGGEDFDVEAFQRQLASRKSVIDAVRLDAEALQKRIGKADKERLDRHFESIRALEQQITVLEANPPQLDACVKPNEPTGNYEQVNGRWPLVEKHRAMADMLVMALACDITRVASLMFSIPVSNPIYPFVCTDGSTEGSCGHHELTHNEPGDQATVQTIIESILGEFVYYVNALSNIEEGNETLLDHMCVLCTTDNSNPKAHSVKNYPLVLAGKCGGALKMGLHYQSPGAGNVSSLGLTVLRAMGVPAEEFGFGVGRVTKGISEIEG